MAEHHPAAPEHKLERLIFFSDAVFAIAITLLVIDLHAPHVSPGATNRDYVDALLAEGPNFGGFLVSFFVIGAFWSSHHRAFALARRWSDALLLPNLLLLCAIAAMPFFTAVLTSAGGLVPNLLYCAWLMLAGLLNIMLQRIVFAAPVVDPAVPPDQIRTIRRRGGAVVLGAATAAIMTPLMPNPAHALLGLATIPLWRRLLTRGVA